MDPRSGSVLSFNMDGRKKRRPLSSTGLSQCLPLLPQEDYSAVPDAMDLIHLDEPGIRAETPLADLKTFHHHPFHSSSSSGHHPQQALQTPTLPIHHVPHQQQMLRGGPEDGNRLVFLERRGVQEAPASTLGLDYFQKDALPGRGGGHDPGGPWGAQQHIDLSAIVESTIVETTQMAAATQPPSFLQPQRPQTQQEEKSILAPISKSFTQHWIDIGNDLNVLLLDFDAAFTLLIPNVERGKPFQTNITTVEVQTRLTSKGQKLTFMKFHFLNPESKIVAPVLDDKALGYKLLKKRSACVFLGRTLDDIKSAPRRRLSPLRPHEQLPPPSPQNNMQPLPLLQQQQLTNNNASLLPLPGTAASSSWNHSSAGPLPDTNLLHAAPPSNPISTTTNAANAELLLKKSISNPVPLSERVYPKNLISIYPALKEHELEKIVVCRYCSKRFSFLSEHLIHLKAHTHDVDKVVEMSIQVWVSDRKLKCDKCKKKKTYTLDYAKHKDSHEIYGLSCHICETPIPTPEQFGPHLEEFHPSEILGEDKAEKMSPGEGKDFIPLVPNLTQDSPHFSSLKTTPPFPSGFVAKKSLPPPSFKSPSAEPISNQRLPPLSLSSAGLMPGEALPPPFLPAEPTHPLISSSQESPNNSVPLLAANSQAFHPGSPAMTTSSQNMGLLNSVFSSHSSNLCMASSPSPHPPPLMAASTESQGKAWRNEDSRVIQSLFDDTDHLSKSAENDKIGLSLSSVDSGVSDVNSGSPSIPHFDRSVPPLLNEGKSIRDSLESKPDEDFLSALGMYGLESAPTTSRKIHSPLDISNQGSELVNSHHILNDEPMLEEIPSKVMQLEELCNTIDMSMEDVPSARKPIQGSPKPLSYPSFNENPEINKGRDWEEPLPSLVEKSSLSPETSPIVGMGGEYTSPPLENAIPQSPSLGVSEDQNTSTDTFETPSKIPGVYSSSKSSGESEDDLGFESPPAIYKCDKCGDEFVTGTSLNIHKISCVTENKCSLCDNRFMSLKSLQMHTSMCKKKSESPKLEEQPPAVLRSSRRRKSRHQSDPCSDENKNILKIKPVVESNHSDDYNDNMYPKTKLRKSESSELKDPDIENFEDPSPPDVPEPKPSLKINVGAILRQHELLQSRHKDKSSKRKKIYESVKYPINSISRKLSTKKPSESSKKELPKRDLYQKPVTASIKVKPPKVPSLKVKFGVSSINREPEKAPLPKPMENSRHLSKQKKRKSKVLEALSSKPQFGSSVRTDSDGHIKLRLTLSSKENVVKEPPEVVKRVLPLKLKLNKIQEELPKLPQPPPMVVPLKIKLPTPKEEPMVEPPKPSIPKLVIKKELISGPPRETVFIKNPSLPPKRLGKEAPSSSQLSSLHANLNSLSCFVRMERLVAYTYEEDKCSSEEGLAIKVTKEDCRLLNPKTISLNHHPPMLVPPLRLKLHKEAPKPKKRTGRSLSSLLSNLTGSQPQILQPRWPLLKKRKKNEESTKNINASSTLSSTLEQLISHPPLSCSDKPSQEKKDKVKVPPAKPTKPMTTKKKDRPAVAPKKSSTYLGLTSADYRSRKRKRKKRKLPTEEEEEHSSSKKVSPPPTPLQENLKVPCLKIKKNLISGSSLAKEGIVPPLKLKTNVFFAKKSMPKPVEDDQSKDNDQKPTSPTLLSSELKTCVVSSEVLINREEKEPTTPMISTEAQNSEKEDVSKMEDISRAENQQSEGTESQQSEDDDDDIPDSLDSPLYRSDATDDAESDPSATLEATPVFQEKDKESDCGSSIEGDKIIVVQDEFLLKLDLWKSSNSRQPYFAIDAHSPLESPFLSSCSPPLSPMEGSDTSFQNANWSQEIVASIVNGLLHASIKDHLKRNRTKDEFPLFKSLRNVKLFKRKHIRPMRPKVESKPKVIEPAELVCPGIISKPIIRIGSQIKADRSRTIEALSKKLRFLKSVHIPIKRRNASPSLPHLKSLTHDVQTRVSTSANFLDFSRDSKPLPIQDPRSQQLRMCSPALKKSSVISLPGKRKSSGLSTSISPKRKCIRNEASLGAISSLSLNSPGILSPNSQYKLLLVEKQRLPPPLELIFRCEDISHVCFDASISENPWGLWRPKKVETSFDFSTLFDLGREKGVLVKSWDIIAWARSITQFVSKKFAHISKRLRNILLGSLMNKRLPITFELGQGKVPDIQILLGPRRCAVKRLRSTRRPLHFLLKTRKLSRCIFPRLTWEATTKGLDTHREPIRRELVTNAAQSSIPPETKSSCVVDYIIQKLLEKTADYSQKPCLEDVSPSTSRNLTQEPVEAVLLDQESSFEATDDIPRGSATFLPQSTCESRDHTDGRLLNEQKYVFRESPCKNCDDVPLRSATSLLPSRADKSHAQELVSNVAAVSKESTPKNSDDFTLRSNTSLQSTCVSGNLDQEIVDKATFVYKESICESPKYVSHKFESSLIVASLVDKLCDNAAFISQESTIDNFYGIPSTSLESSSMIGHLTQVLGKEEALPSKESTLGIYDIQSMSSPLLESSQIVESIIQTLVDKAAATPKELTIENIDNILSEPISCPEPSDIVRSITNAPGEEAVILSQESTLPNIGDVSSRCNVSLESSQIVKVLFENLVEKAFDSYQKSIIHNISLKSSLKVSAGSALNGKPEPSIVSLDDSNVKPSYETPQSVREGLNDMSGLKYQEPTIDSFDESSMESSFEASEPVKGGLTITQDDNPSVIPQESTIEGHSPIKSSLEPSLLIRGPPNLLDEMKTTISTESTLEGPHERPSKSLVESSNLVGGIIQGLVDTAILLFHNSTSESPKHDLQTHVASNVVQKSDFITSSSSSVKSHDPSSITSSESTRAVGVFIQELVDNAVTHSQDTITLPRPRNTGESRHHPKEESGPSTDFFQSLILNICKEIVSRGDTPNSEPCNTNNIVGPVLDELINNLT